MDLLPKNGHPPWNRVCFPETLESGGKPRSSHATNPNSMWEPNEPPTIWGWYGMVFSTHKNGDDLGMVYFYGFTTL